ncbi:hypothetical protein B0H14DRAFT_2594591 [Mycena olivaceomarginata]|nr:hypothetical protein B0H14DRAFT_2594591 [Mycena olivaceomarginata]
MGDLKDSFVTAGINTKADLIKIANWNAPQILGYFRNHFHVDGKCEPLKSFPTYALYMRLAHESCVLWEMRGPASKQEDVRIDGAIPDRPDDLYRAIDQTVQMKAESRLIALRICALTHQHSTTSPSVLAHVWMPENWLVVQCVLGWVQRLRQDMNLLWVLEPDHQTQCGDEAVDKLDPMVALLTCQEFASHPSRKDVVRTEIQEQAADHAGGTRRTVVAGAVADENTPIPAPLYFEEDLTTQAACTAEDFSWDLGSDAVTQLQM